MAFFWVTAVMLVEHIYWHQSSPQRMQEKYATILYIGVLGVLLRDVWVAKATFSLSALNASPLFHDTLLDKINDWIKLHVRFIDNKIRKRMKTFNAINLINPLILYDGYISWRENFQTCSNYRLLSESSSSLTYAGGRAIPMLSHWCISFHSLSFRTFIFNWCSSLAMDKNGSSSRGFSFLALYLLI